MPPDLHHLLAHLPLGPLEYHEFVGSTNDLAAERLAAGAPDLTLITADAQTAGRGRSGRSWHTPPGSALAFSLVLRPGPETPLWSHAPLSALAVHSVLAQDFGLPAEIKWPNDVLVAGRKLCGILAEAHWQGDRLEGVVLGTGVNVQPESVPPGGLAFPATSVESELGGAVDRWRLLARILEEILNWRKTIGGAEFLQAWTERLAFRGARVRVGEREGVLAGLSTGGELLLETDGRQVAIPAGEVSLRPA